MTFLLFKVILGVLRFTWWLWLCFFDDTEGLPQRQCVMYILVGNFLQWVGVVMLRAGMCACKILSSCHFDMTSGLRHLHIKRGFIPGCGVCTVWRGGIPAKREKQQRSAAVFRSVRQLTKWDDKVHLLIGCGGWFA